MTFLTPRGDVIRAHAKPATADAVMTFHPERVENSGENHVSIKIQTTLEVPPCSPQPTPHRSCSRSARSKS